MPWVESSMVYDESYDDESYYDEMESLLGVEGRWETESDEERRYPRFRPGRTRVPAPRPARPMPGVAGARIQTPAGRAEVQFPKPMATKEAVENLARELKAEIARLAGSVKNIGDELNKNTAMLDKKINGLNRDFKKHQEQAMMMVMLPLLMPPKLEEIKTDNTGKVTHQKYKTDLTMMLLLMMMMGGFGGVAGDSGMNTMTMLLLVLALSGGLK